ncbi:hypothetical protein ACM26M_03350 [Kluyvera cryocrescens]|uniref:hypothetical protein n=1 Tax=Kluyvera cryocrescens TaxID=580 RepID=UPI0039F68686
MTYRIETRNYYLRSAIEILFPQYNHEQDTCIIDLNSCNTLHEVLKYVRRNSDVERFIFIGNNGMQSRALQSLISVESNAPLLHCYEKFRHCPGVSYHTAIEVLLEHRSMGSYSHQDKTTVYSLLLRDSMQSAARLIGVSNKLFYQRVDRLSKKLNLRSGLQVHQFFRLEFRPDYVRAKIDEHVRVSVTRQLRL